MQGSVLLKRSLLRHVKVEVSIDERLLIKDEDDVVMPLPLYHLLAQEYVEKEVFVVPKLSVKEVKKPTG